MEYLWDHPFLWYAQAGFTVWMLIDAYRRQTEYYWLWVILFFQPIGAWAYFLLVKRHDFGSIGGVSLLGPRRPSLDELRYRAEQTPTLTTRLELAEALIERGRHVEAMPYLEAALKVESDHCQVLYFLALCWTEQGEPAKALPLLDRIMARDRAWSDYRGWRLLIASRVQTGDGVGALALSRDLARVAPTLQHRCLLAERLMADNLNDEARAMLEESLESHRYAPGHVRRRNRKWASHAKQLLKRSQAT